MQHNTVWTSRLIVPGLVLGAAIISISAAAGYPDPSGSVGARVGGDSSLMAEFIGFPSSGVQVWDVASTSSSSSSSKSSSSSSTSSSSTSSGSSSSSSSSCGPESPCLNGKAVGKVLQKLLKKLNLTTTEASDADTILQGERAAIKAIIAELKKTDGDDPTQDELDAAKTQISALQLKDRASIGKLLTSDQLTQLEKLEKEYCACSQSQSSGKNSKNSSGKCDGSGSGGSSSGGSSSGGSTTTTTTATPTPTPSDTTST